MRIHTLTLILIGTTALLVIIAVTCWALPLYGVYSQRLEGEAELAKAEYSKKVAVQEANAKKDSATLLAEADVMRAEGVAKANKIIGDSLKENESYLRWLWISELKDTKDQIIYIPTEGTMPILEAGHRPAIPMSSAPPPSK
jgi:regulator of protease activity HflC (stomatin/prohibitin superfamily)